MDHFEKEEFIETCVRCEVVAVIKVFDSGAQCSSLLLL